MVQVTDEDAFETARQLGQARGHDVRHQLRRGRLGRHCKSPSRAENAGKLIVVILPDLGERYLSTKLFPE